ncbi:MULTISPECIES: ribosome maturation factor RimP [Mesotoga]|uniref:ribosome maturation factor RimP n=1 Tax=Mesotoga TaxID=1184396 RepID=UPI0002F13AE6|nr:MULTISPECIES: ribosome maturation factor RimP [Mesotoga]HNQ70396.1 ribosome maturation factor RimP [Mesotoga prima]HNS75153.1 ribosome maturation factor RimP [Mesotoga prima]HOP36666.1 ribosome maturation factor RimP [Mesotoga prima]HPE52712.1 ribosome maturation factor RimP [Mesotoga prima]HPJ31904.1 ribosome maturation factor RimP [Mesotoga prima]
MEDLKKELFELANEVASNLGYSIYDLGLGRRGKKRLVKITIDKLDGYVSISDCESFSADFGRALDSADLVPFSYDLVVESPGLERALRDLKDYVRFTGEKAKVILKEPIEGVSVLIGKIISCENDVVTVESSENGKEIAFHFSNVKRANLKL